MPDQESTAQPNRPRPALSASHGSGPLRIVMSREEIEDKAKAYLLEYFDEKTNDDFYLRLGMMVDFSHFLFQNAKGDSQSPDK